MRDGAREHSKQREGRHPVALPSEVTLILEAHTDRFTLEFLADLLQTF